MSDFKLLRHGYTGEVTVEVLLRLYDDYMRRNKRTSLATHWLVDEPTFAAICMLKMGNGVNVVTVDERRIQDPPSYTPPHRALGIPIIVAKYPPDSIILIERLPDRV